ncbi:MAG: helix-turn-helix domain-containing protein [Chloroflexi bacterium]|nr:helix-turn-helix domain-containing protein [Chloroflexota bacterium]
MAKVFDRVAIDSWLRDEVVQKFPKGGLGDIKTGSPCIVNPGETAVFVRGGKSMGTLEQGRHILTTENIPFLTDWAERLFTGGKNVFTADVYYLKTTDITMKWGTTQPIIIEHMQRSPGASAIVGNGTYVVRIKDPWRFLNAMDAFRDSVRQSQLKERLDPKLGIMMQDKMSELAEAKNLGPAQLQSFSQDINDLLVGLLQSEFDAIGMVLVDFNIRMGLHPKSLEVVTNMGYGTSYAQKQQADAFVAAAENPSGGKMSDIGLGAMGMAAMQNMQNSQQQQQQQQQQPPQQAAPAQSGGGGMPDVMTPQQAAQYLQVSPEDVVAAIDAGDLKARKIGSAYRISKSNLEAFLSG